MKALHVYRVPFDDKLLREVPDFCVAHILHLSFPFGLLPRDLRLRFEFVEEKTHQSLAF